MSTRLIPTWRSAAVCLACAWVLPSCSVGHISGDEPTDGRAVSTPIIDGTAATDYPEAALVDMQRGGRTSAFCSGSVIAPKVVLTAGHCVDGFDGWRVTAPYASRQSATSSSGTTFDWREGGSRTVNPRHHDIGLVFLDSAITLNRYPVLARSGLADGSTVINVGRIDDGTLSRTDLFKSAEVAVFDGARVGFPFDYAASVVIQSGDSGGPDFLPGAPPHTIVSVNSGAGGTREVLARVDLLYDWIQGQIASHGGAGGGGGSGGGGGAGGGGGGRGSPGYLQANALPRGTMCGDISPGTDQDWFTWSVGSAGVAYDLRLVATGDAQLRMWKNTASGYTQVANTTATRLAHTSSGAGTYVVATWSPGKNVQSYRLSLATNE